MRRMTTPAGSAAVFTAALLLAAPFAATPAAALFGSDPGEEAPFITSVEPGRWTPSIVDGSAAAQQRGGQQAGGNRFMRDDMPGSATATAQGNVQSGERLSPYSDGLTTARLASYGLVPVPAIEAYLNDIAAKLLAEAPVTGAPADIRVVGSQNLGDAAAMPDGVITVPIGLLANADSEDEIAGLLAHELTHVILNHHDSDWLSRTNQQLVSAAEIGAGVMFDLGRSMGVIDEGELSKEVLIGYAGSQATLFLSGTVLTPDWSRDQELEADMMALDLMVAADYSPEAYIELLYKVADQEALMPTKAERVAQLREQVDARANAMMASGLQEGDEFKIGLGLFEKGAFELDQAFEPLRDTHPSTEERIELLFAYFERHYAEDPDVNLIPTEGSLVALRQDPTVRQVLANYEAAWRAQLLADGSAEAERLARKGVSGPTADHALPRLAFATVRGSQGDTRRERLNLTYAMQGAEPNLQIYSRAIVFDLTSGDRTSAFALIDDAWERFKRPAGLYPFKIYAAVVQGERQQANALNVDCRLYFRSNARICTEALEGRLEALLEPQSVPSHTPAPVVEKSLGGEGSGSASGFLPTGNVTRTPAPSSGGGLGGLFGGVLDGLPRAPADDGVNQFEGGAGSGNDN